MLSQVASPSALLSTGLFGGTRKLQKVGYFDRNIRFFKNSNLEQVFGGLQSFKLPKKYGGKLQKFSLGPTSRKELEFSSGRT
jgi:hypothetical protein